MDRCGWSFFLEMLCPFPPNTIFSSTFFSSVLSLILVFPCFFCIKMYPSYSIPAFHSNLYWVTDPFENLIHISTELYTISNINLFPLWSRDIIAPKLLYTLLPQWFANKLVLLPLINSIFQIFISSSNLSWVQNHIYVYQKPHLSFDNNTDNSSSTWFHLL